MSLDHPALLSAFSQLQIFPPAARESLYQKKQKGEVQIFFEIPSASSTTPPFLLLQTEWITSQKRSWLLSSFKFILFPGKFSSGFCEKLKGIILSSCLVPAQSGAHNIPLAYPANPILGQVLYFVKAADL